MRRILSFAVLANSFFVNAGARDVNIHYACQSEWALCLESLPEHLAKVEEGSVPWYKLKAYEYQALYNSELREKLKSELEQVKSIENTPIEFQLAWTISYAKVLSYFKEHYRAQQYIKSGLGLFEKLKGNYASPRKLIELANLQYYEALAYRSIDNQALFEHKLVETQQTLQWIKDNNNNVSDPKFHQSLNANFGHVAMKRKRFDEAIRAFSKMLFWAKQSDNIQQISVANYNVARAAQEAGLLDKSLDYFTEALALVENTEYEEHKVACYLRLMQVNMALGKEDEVLHFDKLIQPLKLALFHETLYQKIKSGI